MPKAMFRKCAVETGDVVVEQMEEKGPWVAKGNVKEVCCGDNCLWSSDANYMANTGRPEGSV